MRVIIKKIPYKAGDCFTIVFFGDLHLGLKHIDWNCLQRVLNFIKNNDCWWIGMGDWAHAIVPHPQEKRFDFEDLDLELLTPDLQYRKVQELLQPIAKKCIVLLTGNHDEVLRKRHYHDFVDALAYNLGVTYGGINAFVRLAFYRGNGRSRHHSRFDLYVHHGYFGGRTKSGKLKRLTDMELLMDADIYAMGHIHEIDWTTLTQLCVDSRGNIKQRVKYFLATGSFMKGYPEGPSHLYVEKKMLRPTRLGAIGLRIWPETRKVEVFEIT